jgi:DNA-binding NarL/FixJ family response regulator
MMAEPEIVLHLKPDEEDIVDREIINKIMEQGGSLESAANRLNRSHATIRRRMGNMMIRLLVKEKTH